MMARVHLLLRCSYLFVALQLAACGWRLQGEARLPDSMRELRVATGDTYSDFYRELRGRLQAAGAAVHTVEVRASSPEEIVGTAGAVLQVYVDEAGQRVLSVSTRNTPEEYEVYYRVEYSLRIDGVELIARQRVELTRAYSYDSQAVLGKQREQSVLQQALARDIVALVMRRIDTVGSRESLAAREGGSVPRT